MPRITVCIVCLVIRIVKERNCPLRRVRIIRPLDIVVHAYFRFLTQAHKHLPEMRVVCGLESNPVFSPIVDDYYKGMATTIPLHMTQLQGVSTLQGVRELYRAHYDGSEAVSVADSVPGLIYGAAFAGKDTLSILVTGNNERFAVTALFDNLGKGASGAAVQNMNLMLGFPETAGLNLD